MVGDEIASDANSGLAMTRGGTEIELSTAFTHIDVTHLSIYTYGYFLNISKLT